jgi:hypothetical protein
MSQPDTSNPIKQIRWMGEVPPTCQTCPNPIVNLFYDEKTRMGPWGILCHTCHTLGPGIGQLGQGYGQRYEKIGSVWVKTAG